MENTEYSGATPSGEIAEISTLGALLFDPSRIPLIASALKPEMFTSNARRELFNVLLELSKEGTAIDTTTVADRIKGNGIYQKIGGAEGLVQLYESVPTASNVGYYADIVRRRYYYKLITQQAREISKAASVSPTNAHDLVSQTLKTMREYLTRAAPKMTTLNEVIQQTTKRLMGHSDVIAWGLPSLDNCMGGILRRSPIFVAARTSNFKTSFCMDRTLHWIRNGHRVLYFGLESPNDELLWKIIAQTGDFSLNLIRRGVLTKEQLKWVEDVCETIKSEYQDRLMILDFSNGIRDINRIIAAAHEFQPDIFIVDYIQHIKTDPRHRRVELGDHARELKVLAHDLDCGCIIVSQILRAAVTRTAGGLLPKLHDLKETGEFEEMAEAVLLLHYPYFHNHKPEDKNKLRIELAKNKSGPLTVVMMHCDPDKSLVRENGISLS